MSIKLNNGISIQNIKLESLEDYKIEVPKLSPRVDRSWQFLKQNEV